MYKKIKISLLIVMALLGICAFYFFNPATTSYFFSCPFKTITSFDCPGCGSQRAIHQLLHGNFVKAFYLNPLLLCSLPILFYGLGIQAYNYIFSKKVRGLLFYNKWFIFGYFSVAFLFGIYRNTSLYPF